MYHVSAQGADEHMINVHYYYHYVLHVLLHLTVLCTASTPACKGTMYCIYSGI